MIAAFIIATISSCATMLWLAHTLIQELRRKQDEINTLNQKLIAWEDELSTEMPPEFKDWWQNDREDWPLIAAAYIKSLKADNERAWDMALKNKRP